LVGKRGPSTIERAVRRRAKATVLSSNEARENRNWIEKKKPDVEIFHYGKRVFTDNGVRVKQNRAPRTMKRRLVSQQNQRGVTLDPPRKWAGRERAPKQNASKLDKWAATAEGGPGVGMIYESGAREMRREKRKWQFCIREPRSAVLQVTGGAMDWFVTQGGIPMGREVFCAVSGRTKGEEKADGPFRVVRWCLSLSTFEGRLRVSDRKKTRPSPEMTSPVGNRGGKKAGRDPLNPNEPKDKAAAFLA